MLTCYLMDPDTDVCQTEQPQISYSVDFTAEQISAMGSPILLDREGSWWRRAEGESPPVSRTSELARVTCYKSHFGPPL